VRRFTSIHARTTHFEQLTDITLQDVANLKYKLELFVRNEEIHLHNKDSRSWIPAQRPYALRPLQCTLTETNIYLVVFLRHLKCT
jgi:hypothetical protein